MTATVTWVRDAGVVIGGTHLTLADALLDKTSWQDVGKTRGWTKAFENEAHPVWKDVWHKFIDHLQDNLTIEDSLAALKNNSL